MIKKVSTANKILKSQDKIKIHEPTVMESSYFLGPIQYLIWKTI